VNAIREGSDNDEVSLLISELLSMWFFLPFLGGKEIHQTWRFGGTPFLLLVETGG